MTWANTILYLVKQQHLDIIHLYNVVSATHGLYSPKLYIALFTVFLYSALERTYYKKNSFPL